MLYNHIRRKGNMVHSYKIHHIEYLNFFNKEHTYTTNKEQIEET